MILIADSGSTKTDWCIVFNDTPIKRMGTKGINPFFQSEEEIQQELTHSLLPQLPDAGFCIEICAGDCCRITISGISFS